MSQMAVDSLMAQPQSYREPSRKLVAMIDKPSSLVIDTLDRCSVAGRSLKTE